MCTRKVQFILKRLRTAQRHEPHARRAPRVGFLGGGRDGVQRRVGAVAGSSAGAFAGAGMFNNFQSNSP